jgi:hypothetical protein
MRKAVAARLTTFRVRFFRILPPLNSLEGRARARRRNDFHSASDFADDCLPVITSIPSIRVRFTPLIRCSS